VRKVGGKVFAIASNGSSNSHKGLTDDELRGYIRPFYALMVRGLLKKMRTELGLGTP
jgi:predicted DNA-binding protein (MmcQ/YjbR family)